MPIRKTIHARKASVTGQFRISVKIFGVDIDEDLVSDNVHRELTRLLGEMMAQSGKAQTFSDVIEALVSRSVLLLPEMLRHVEEFIEANKQLGYTTREEFIREAVNEMLRRLSENRST